MKIQVLGEKPLPVSFLPSRIPHGYLLYYVNEWMNVCMHVLKSVYPTAGALNTSYMENKADLERKAPVVVPRGLLA